MRTPSWATPLRSCNEHTHTSVSFVCECETWAVSILVHLVALSTLSLEHLLPLTPSWLLSCLSLSTSFATETHAQLSCSCSVHSARVKRANLCCVNVENYETTQTLAPPRRKEEIFGKKRRSVLLHPPPKCTKQPFVQPPHTKSRHLVCVSLCVALFLSASWILAALRWSSPPPACVSIKGTACCPLAQGTHFLVAVPHAHRCLPQC